MRCAFFVLDNKALQDAQYTHYNRISILGSVMSLYSWYRKFKIHG